MLPVCARDGCGLQEGRVLEGALGPFILWPDGQLPEANGIPFPDPRSRTISDVSRQSECTGRTGSRLPEIIDFASYQNFES